MNAQGLVVRRSEHLVYKRSNGNDAPTAVIKDKYYDLTDTTDFATVIEEREQGR